MPELQYEPSTAARPVVVEQEGEITRVIVLMKGLYLPTGNWAVGLGVAGVIVIALWMLGSWLVRLCLRLPTPPRAVFEISPNEVAMALRDPTSGEKQEFRWPRTAVVEIRANRFERGLWVDVPGHVRETFLQDVTRETIAKLEAELREVLPSRSKDKMT